MAVKRNGLGKGLDSLIPNKTEKTVKTEKKPEQKNEESQNSSGEILVKINQVEPNREQPRKEFDEDSLMELADSIKQFGILQPLLVQKRKDYYEIIAGERRWRAAKIAGIKENFPKKLKNLHINNQPSMNVGYLYDDISKNLLVQLSTEQIARSKRIGTADINLLLRMRRAAKRLQFLI